jgi:hypothetical protein
MVSVQVASWRNVEDETGEVDESDEKRTESARREPWKENTN